MGRGGGLILIVVGLLILWAILTNRYGILERAVYELFGLSPVPEAPAPAPVDPVEAVGRAGATVPDSGIDPSKMSRPRTVRTPDFNPNTGGVGFPTNNNYLPNTRRYLSTRGQ